MSTKRNSHLGVAALIAAASLGATGVQAQKVGAADIGGVVSGPKGPEAGVWVIAETTDLPTKYAKVVVTDDKGRYLIPQLPNANYSVWVRGYGLVDSRKIKARPGKSLSLQAVPAPSEKAAAEFYPGMYWYSMLKIPEKSEFPGTGEQGNGISPNIKTQEQWVDTMKNACQSCHSLGSHGMRTVPKEFGPGFAGWARRTQSGQALTLETGDSAKSQGWTQIVVDTNGNGKRDEGDTRLTAAAYGIMPSSVDDSIWAQSMGIGFGRMNQPGYVMRIVPGSNPSETALTEVYVPPEGA